MAPVAEDIWAAQEHFGFLTPAPVEKDWHVLRALRVINAIDTAPFQLVFAGGTCLARAYRMVNRMSEDVDFKVVPLDPMPLSRSKRRSLLGDLRARVLAALQAEGFHIGPQDLRSRDENQYTLYHLKQPLMWLRRWCTKRGPLGESMRSAPARPFSEPEQYPQLLIEILTKKPNLIIIQAA